MTKSVSLEHLRERLEDYVDDATRGDVVNITKDGYVVATIAPPPREPRARLRDFVPGLRPKNLTVDPAALLIQERERERSS